MCIIVHTLYVSSELQLAFQLPLFSLFIFARARIASQLSKMELCVYSSYYLEDPHMQKSFL